MTATKDSVPNGNGEMKKSAETRKYPIVHAATDAPICKNCSQLGFSFNDPNCFYCIEILQSPETTISQIFAIIRQWVPQSQQNIEMLVNEILDRGANVNDKDSLTDMTLLHYACKSGASGLGDVTTSLKTVGFLLDKGADINAICCWTEMAAIHYAAYFDVAPVIELLLKASKGQGINMQCKSYGESPLHIAATNLSTEAVKVLLENNADTTLQDFSGRTPLECIPDASSLHSTPHMKDAISSIRQLLEATTPKHIFEDHRDYSNVSGKAVLNALGIQIGDKVVVGGAKIGYLRYCGTTQFANGIWAGIELDEPLGKNDGTLKEVSYFACPPGHGIFAPISKVSKYDHHPSHYRSPFSHRNLPVRSISFSRVDVSHVTSKIETGLSSIRRHNSHELYDFAVGDRILVSGHRKGTIRFAGETEFASGFWYGIELDKSQGRNDGSINDVQYFHCAPGFGLFAPPHRICRLVKSSEEDSSDHDSVDLSTMSKSSTDFDLGILSPISPRSISMSSSFRSTRRHARTTNQLSSPSTPQKSCWLTVGINVFVNNEIGAVRYVGPVEFAEGTWLGIELRCPKGKNDGTVQGKSYFVCKPGYGLLVRPNRVTVRGINGAKLLSEQSS